ncbi:MAG: amino-acid N-acetyltransferase [Verrucomicrobiales bacterium]|nr:amino-acid N-acetyltransferase [Verrucomicrobiales bacterium]
MRPSELRGILAYTSKFRDKTFVLSIDSDVIAHPNFRNLILDISVLRSLSIDIVVVHGASYQIKSLSAALNVTPTNTDGMGVTDEATLRLSILAANQIAHEFLKTFSEADQRAAVTNAIIAHPSGIVSGSDQCWTGRVERVDTAYLQSLVEQGIIPVVPPLGFDGEGRTFRVNSDGVAQEVAGALKAAKLIYLTNNNGVVGAGSLSAQFAVSEAADYIKKHRAALAPDTVSKLEHGLAACRNGVNRAHLINGQQEEALLSEVFSNEGIGTMIYASDYEAIRKALKKDARPIVRLIKNSVQEGELIPRSEADIAAQIGDFFVFEIDRNIVGCVALHYYNGEPRTAELKCLFVSGGHENQGVGRKLMNFVEAKARQAGVENLLVLSTRTFNYFQQKGGFTDADIDLLPPERRAEYEANKRNSKVLHKKLR